MLSILIHRRGDDAGKILWRAPCLNSCNLLNSDRQESLEVICAITWIAFSWRLNSLKNRSTCSTAPEIPDTVQWYSVLTHHAQARRLYWRVCGRHKRVHDRIHERWNDHSLFSVEAHGRAKARMSRRFPSLERRLAVETDINSGMSTKVVIHPKTDYETNSKPN